MTCQKSELNKHILYLTRHLSRSRGHQPLSVSRVQDSSLSNEILDWLDPTQPVLIWSVKQYSGSRNVRLASDSKATRELVVFGAIIPGTTGFLNAIALPEIMWLFNHKRTDFRHIYPIEKFLGSFGVFPTALRLLDLIR